MKNSTIIAIDHSIVPPEKGYKPFYYKDLLLVKEAADDGGSVKVQLKAHKLRR